MKSVIITAYACKYGSGSEPGAGYWWSTAASNSAKVILITRPLDEDTRNQLQKHDIVIHEVNVQHNSKVPQLSYIRWLILAQRTMTNIHRNTPVDLTHHVTYATDWLPAPTLAGIPHIWGPVGGSTGVPKELATLYSRKLQLKETLRSIVTNSARVFTRVWAKNNVSIILAQNKDTARSFSSHNRVEVRVNCVIGDEQKLANYPFREPKSIAIVGRLIEMKGVHLALKALATETLSEWTLHIVGDGPTRSSLIKSANELGVSKRVTFHGQVDRAEVTRILAGVSCSLLLSTHDAAGWAAAESIAVGTPVVTWSHGGPAELVDMSNCGVRVSMSKPIIQSLSTAIYDAAIIKAQPTNLFHYSDLSEDLYNWYASV